MATWLILEDDRFNFDYCHFLPWHAAQCRSLHGHSSVVTVMLRGEPDAQGFVIDFGEAKQLVKETLTLFDHKRMPARVQRVMVRMFEGVGKSALAMVGVAGDAGMGLISGTDTTGGLLSIDQLLVQVES